MTSLRMSSLQLQVIIEETGEHRSFSMAEAYDKEGVQLAVDERIELALSKSHFQDYSVVHLRFEIVDGHDIVQTMPGYGALAVDLDETYADNWFV
jgi:hypothetical protein